MSKRAKEKSAAKPRNKKETYSLLIRHVPLAMKRRLDATRAKMGFRAVNEAVVALLDEGAEK